MSEWISVKDKLPDLQERVLVYNGLSVYVDERLRFLDDWLWAKSHKAPTHKMPLPEPPEVIEK